MEPIIITGTVGDISTEDSGAAKIADLDDEESTGSPEFFVRLQSYNDNFDSTDKQMHPTMDALAGKKVRITVEVIE
jgi:hypothetical protein